MSLGYIPSKRTKIVIQCGSPKIANVKKIMYAIVFTTERLAIQVPVPKGKSMNARCNQKNILRKFVFFSRNRDQRRVNEAVICFMTTPRDTRLAVWNYDIVSK